MKEKTDNIDILEELANNEHIRWANWQKYVHSKCIKNDDGSLTIPKEYVEHWEYEINTNYEDLPEEIKESDRKEVRQILDKINYSTLIAENKELKEKYSRKLIDFQKEREEYERDYIPKLKVEELIKKYEWSIEHYDSDEADYRQSQDVGSWHALQSLLGKE